MCSLESLEVLRRKQGSDRIRTFKSCFSFLFGWVESAGGPAGSGSVCSLVLSSVGFHWVLRPPVCPNHYFGRPVRFPPVHGVVQNAGAKGGIQAHGGDLPIFPFAGEWVEAVVVAAPMIRKRTVWP